jgi:hypothetical protein
MSVKMNKNLWISILLSLLVVGLFAWLAFWQFGGIKNTSDNIQEEMLSSKVQEEKKQKILELGKELENIEENSKEMNLMLVDKGSAVSFLEALEKIANDTGNTIRIGVFDLSKMKSPTTKKPVLQETDTESTKAVQKDSQAKKSASSQTAKQDFSNQLGFSLEVEGTFQTLVDFFSKLENLPYFVQVYNFDSVIPPKIQAPAALSSNENQGENQTGEASSEEQNSKKIKTVITIGVYTNGGK